MGVKLVRLIILIGAVLAATSAASAQPQAPIFFDAFLFDNAGQPANDFNLFFQWNVTDGTVDLVGGNVPGADEPPAGRLVDLDGGDAGAFATRTQFTFLAGATYNLSFRYLSTDGGANSATATIGSQVFNFGTSSTTFQTFSADFTFASTTTAELVFQDSGNDDAGVGIDRVMLSAVAAVPSPQGILISEYRLRGPSGAQDEFIEIYNNTDTPRTVTTSDNSVGWAVVSADDPLTPKFIIPAGTVIPARGHFLGANGNGYSLSLYPAGNDGDIDETTAFANAPYFVDIPDNRGVAIFNTANPINFSPLTRFDAVGSAAEVNPLFKEGAGHAPVNAGANIQYSFVRRLPGGCTGSSGGVGDNCNSAAQVQSAPPPSSTNSQDTNDNANDFIFVDTAATDAGAGRRRGAPGPENLSGPVAMDSRRIVITSLDPAVSSSAPPNRVRVLTSDEPNNSTFGTISIRRTFTNNTGSPVTRLRLRVVDITTTPSAIGVADLRPRSSGQTVVATSGGDKTVEGTTLEETPTPAQPFGGGFNSSLAASTVTLAAPLDSEALVDLQILLGVQQNGKFRFFISVEALNEPEPIQTFGGGQFIRGGGGLKVIGERPQGRAN